MVINIIVINKVKYTEIDWIAYMQVDFFFLWEYSTLIYDFSFVEIIVEKSIARGREGTPHLFLSDHK